MITRAIRGPSATTVDLVPDVGNLFTRPLETSASTTAEVQRRFRTSAAIGSLKSNSVLPPILNGRHAPASPRRLAQDVRDLPIQR